MFSINVKLGFLSITVFPIFYLSTYIFSKKLKKVTKLNREKATDSLSYFQESISGYEIIKNNSLENNILGNFVRIGREVITLQIKRDMTARMSSTMLELFSSTIPILLLFYGAYLVFQDSLTIGLLIVYYNYPNKIFLPFNRLSRINIAIQNVSVSLNRLLDFLNVQPQIRETSTSKPFNAIIQSIHFKNVTFSYENNNVLFNNLNFSIKNGQYIAFVGHSGCGKTSIINLLLRHYNVSGGKILINDCPIENLTLKSLRNQFSVVSQDTFLFNDTIANNLKFIDRNLAMDQIIKACKMVQMHEFIESLPNGYNTNIGERGTNLSGGQKQRLSIARAILKKAPVLIFDEATAQLDNNSEYNIQNMIDGSFADHTRVTIAHRLTTIMNCDMIFYIKDGQISESGKHNDLLKLNKDYFNLWTIQQER